MSTFLHENFLLLSSTYGKYNAITHGWTPGTHFGSPRGTIWSTVAALLRSVVCFVFDVSSFFFGVTIVSYVLKAVNDKDD